MVCFAWSRLYGHSPFALDSLTSKVSYTETSTEFDTKRNFLELYSFITYCVLKHRYPVPGHFDSNGMLMRIMTMTVIIFTARCTEQIVCVGNILYVPATEVVELSTRHGIHCLRFLLFVLSACSQRFASRSVKATTLTCTSVAEHEDCPISSFHTV